MSIISISNTIPNIINLPGQGGGGDEAFSSTKSLEFDGTDDYILTSPTYSAMDGLSNWAYSFWINFDDLSSNRNVFGISNGGVSSYAFVQCYWNAATSRLQMYFDGLSYYCRTDAAKWTPVTGTWYHVLVTRDSSKPVGSTITWYIDGVDCSLNESMVAAPTTTATSGIYIGDNDGFSYSPFAGNIDEFAVYTQKMGAYKDEIYNSGTPDDLNNLATAPAPDLWYRMGENSTFSSQILMPENTNKDKVSNYSMAFDGTGDYIDCGTGIGTSFGDGYTGGIVVSLWFKADTTSGDDGLFTFGGTGSYGELSVGLKANYLDVYVANSLKLHHSFTDTTDWHNLVINLDGSATSTNQVYLDGAPIGSTFGPYTALDLDAVTFFIAQYYTSFYPFQGKIDEVSIFNTAKAIGDIWDGTGKPTDLTEESGLVGYWKMGEEAVFNSTNWLLPNKAQDVFSRYSMEFDGIDDYVDTGAKLSVDGLATASFSLWFLTDSTGYKYIFGDNKNRLLYHQPSGRIDLTFDGSVDYRTYSAPTVFGDWNNIVITFDGSLAQADRLKVYLNGGTPIANTLGGTTSTVVASVVNFYIGRAGWYSANEWVGNLDEFSIWNTALSQSEVTEIYNIGTPNDLATHSGAAALVNWWRMGDDATYDAVASEWTVPDQAGSNDGTSANMTNDDLTGDAPGVSGNGTSANMTIEDRVGDAPDSENNSLSYNMDAADIKTEAP